MSEHRINSYLFLYYLICVLFSNDVFSQFPNFNFGGGGGGGGGGGSCPSGTGWYSLSMAAMLGMPAMPGCIYVDKSSNVSWSQGQKLCKEQDSRSDLPFFTNYSQMKTFQNMAPMLSMQIGKVTIWLGGYSNRTDNKWRYLDSSEMMTNSTGGWTNGAPNATVGIPQRCLGFALGGSDTGWRDMPCTQKTAFGCYIGDTNIPQKNSTNIKPNATGLKSPAKECPKNVNWVPAGGFCYITSSTMVAGYAAADTYCKSLDPRATLPQFYYQSDYDNFTIFVGDIADAEHQKIYLATRKTSGKFQNPDNTFAFTNWYTNQPLNGDCVFTVDTIGFSWNSSDCSDQAYVVCQLNTSIAAPAITATSTPTVTTTKTTTSITTTTTKLTTTTTSNKQTTNASVTAVASASSTLSVSTNSVSQNNVSITSVSALPSSAQNSTSNSSSLATNAVQNATDIAASSSTSSTITQAVTTSTVSTIPTTSTVLQGNSQAAAVVTTVISATVQTADPNAVGNSSPATSVTDKPEEPKNNVVEPVENVAKPKIDVVDQRNFRVDGIPEAKQQVIKLGPSYSMSWDTPVWFLIVLALLVLIPIMFWCAAICFKEARDRKYRDPPHPQKADVQTPPVQPGQTDYILM